MEVEKVGDIELRFTKSGELDEIVVPGKLHLERMDINHVWIGLYGEGHQRFIQVGSDSAIEMIAEEIEEEEDD